jgi:hypothetical protein
MDRVEVMHPRSVRAEPRRVGVHVGQQEVGRGHERHAPPVRPDAALVGVVYPGDLSGVDVAASGLRGLASGPEEPRRGPGRAEFVEGRLGQRQASEVTGAGRREPDEIRDGEAVLGDALGGESEVAVIPRDHAERLSPHVCKLAKASPSVSVSIAERASRERIEGDHYAPRTSGFHERTTGVPARPSASRGWKTRK